MMISSLALTSVSTLPEIRMATPVGAPPSGHAAPSGDFTSVLKGVATETAGALRQGEAAAILGVQGQLPLQSVVERVMAAERALQTGIAIRDKLVSSYLEITRMQI